jgi:hypothetical protein
MIRDLKSFYVVIHDNKVICCGTNLSKFISLFKEIEPEIEGYHYFLKEFKNKNRLVFINKSDKIYFLQKVI